MFSIKKILCPTDFSLCSNHAFHFACALARDHGGSLVVLHVNQPIEAIGGEFGMLHGESEKTREQLLARLSQIRPIDPEIAIEYELITGDPVSRILAVAQAFGCDLIVMGTHGRTGLTHLLMGSVAERVMRRAPCPLLTVKIPLPDAEPNGPQGGSAPSV